MSQLTPLSVEVLRSPDGSVRVSALYSAVDLLELPDDHMKFLESCLRCLRATGPISINQARKAGITRLQHALISSTIPSHIERLQHALISSTIPSHIELLLTETGEFHENHVRYHSGLPFHMYTTLVPLATLNLDLAVWLPYEPRK